jgi:hypothetical protein
MVKPLRTNEAQPFNVIDARTGVDVESVTQTEENRVCRPLWG